MRTVPTPQEWSEEQQARSEVRRFEIWIPAVLTPIVPELVYVATGKTVLATMGDGRAVQCV